MSQTSLFDQATEATEALRAKFLIRYPDERLILSTIDEYVQAVHDSGRVRIDWAIRTYRRCGSRKWRIGDKTYELEEFEVDQCFDIRPEIKAFIEKNPQAFYLFDRELLDGPYAPR